MARRVDDVDQEILVVDGRVLGHDRDAALPLELVAVHGALGHALVGAERAALVQQRIDERRLAVIDVRDDGDVAPQRIGDPGAIGRGQWRFNGHRHPPSIRNLVVRIAGLQDCSKARLDSVVFPFCPSLSAILQSCNFVDAKARLQ